jgi:hypothetical protein
MNNQEYNEYKEVLYAEYTNYMDDLSQLAKENKEAKSNETFIKMELLDYLLSNAYIYDTKYLVKENIIDYYYNDFIKTNYDFTDKDFHKFFLQETRKMKKQIDNDNEM